MENKETVEFLLEENEICCPEVLDLFYTISKLSDEYLINSEELY